MTILESGVLPDREVTCSLKAVEPVAALNCILGQYDLEAMDIVGDSSCAVWRVLPRIPRSQFVHFVFRQVGDNRSDPLESKINLQMRNAELADILEGIARRTEINLSCSPELRGRLTVGFTNAEARGVFSSLGGVSGINLVPWRWNEGRDYVIMASRFSIPSPSPAIKTRQRTHGWIVGLGVLCVAQFAVILVLLGKRRQATQVDR